MPKKKLSEETRGAIIWLERQPGVTAVIQGRFTRTSHRHKPGFSRIGSMTETVVSVRTYDRIGQRELIVHAAMSPLRDKWVSSLAAGVVIGTDVGPSQSVEHKAATLPKAPEASPVPAPGSAILRADAGQLYEVTPALAEQWLEHNTRNRKLRGDVVAKYAADMKAGLWQVSPDAIAFDTNGACVNGQHRLWAVFESGVTVPMLVMFGLDPDVISVLDDHLKRNLVDVHRIRRPGSTITTMQAAVANMLLQSRIAATAVDRRQARKRISRQVQLDVLDRHIDAIEFAVRECFRSARMRSITVAPVLTPVARAYYTQDQERLLQFGKVMLQGMTESVDDKAAILLRNMLLKAASARVASATDVVYRKTERALLAFLKREPITTLYEAASELFPLPEDSAVAG